MRNPVYNLIASAPAEVRYKIAAGIKEIIETEGPAAFESPKEAAAIHEAAHAIVGEHEGVPVHKIWIFQKTWNDDTAWLGFAHSRKRWSVGAATDPDDDLRRARFQHRWPDR